jgi:excisionase family DNA binding protein
MLTVQEVAERVGLSHWSVRRAITAGELRAFKLRGHLRVSYAALDEWLAASEVHPVEAKREVATARLRALTDRRREPRTRASVPGLGSFRPGHYERDNRNQRRR